MSLKSNFGTFIDRAINELRTGRPIVIKEDKNYWMFFNIEHSDNKILNQFNINQNKRSHKFYRYINEIPTILLILIVFVVIFKPL